MIEHKGRDNRAPQQRCIDAIGALIRLLDTEPHAPRVMTLYLARERDGARANGLPRDIDQLFDIVDAVKKVFELDSRTGYEKLVWHAEVGTQSAAQAGVARASRG